MTITFKDPEKQKRYGRKLARLFAKEQTKLELLLDTESPLVEYPPVDEMTTEQLNDYLNKGEYLYWSLERDKAGNILKVKPYTSRTVARNLHKAVQREKIAYISDIFSDFDSRGGLR